MSYGYKTVRMESLLKRRQRLLAKLPALDEVLRGSIVERSIRCGKAQCRCAAGELHTVVYLSVTHRGGRTEQISLPRELLPTVRDGVRIYQQWWEILEQVSAVNRELLRVRRAKRGGVADGSGRSTARRRRRELS
jgi:hypothetical protein